jgi:tetratricopeptide (TPR) repeat protein
MATIEEIEEYTKKAEEGNEDAQWNLGLYYEENRDFQKAEYWYTKAAEQGFSTYQCNLGFFYEKYYEDQEKAVYWYTKAAEQDNAQAQYNLAISFERGEGVPKDIEKAIYWYTKSAEQDHVGSQNNLGALYLDGKLVSTDLTKAKYWFTKAAEQGNEVAQRNLNRVNERRSSSGCCYVATCVYGSYDCPEVWTLRRFRDLKLSKSWFGKQFIRFYYAVSPKIVELFGNNKWFNRFWKPILDALIRKLQNSGIDSSSYSD